MLKNMLLNNGVKKEDQKEVQQQNVPTCYQSFWLLPTWLEGYSYML